jgi:hypothetical protein
MKKHQKRLALLEAHLITLAKELRMHAHQPNYLGPNIKTFEESMDDLNEYIEVGEYGIAYELIVALLKHAPFHLSPKFTLTLLEVGLLLEGKKTHG